MYMSVCGFDGVVAGPKCKPLTALTSKHFSQVNGFMWCKCHLCAWRGLSTDVQQACDALQAGCYVF